MDLIWQVVIGVLVAVLAAAPVAVITRRVIRETGGGSDGAVVAGGDATVDRSITYSPTNITYQVIRNYITNHGPPGRQNGHGSDDDDGWTAMIGTVIAVVVVATVFAVYANLFLIGSVCVTATLIICASLLTTTTHHQFGSLPRPTISALSHVGLVVILTGRLGSGPHNRASRRQPQRCDRYRPVDRQTASGVRTSE